MTVNLPIDRRVEVLERAIAELTSTGPSGRLHRLGPQRQVFLGLTKAFPEAEYPTSGRTVPIRFLDREFTAEAGAAEGTNRFRSADATVYAEVLLGSLPPEETLVQIFFHPPPPGTIGKGRWFVVPAADGVFRFELKDDLELGQFAAAYKCKLSNGIWIKTDEEIIVHDPFTNPGCWMGYGPKPIDAEDPDAGFTKGYQGFCVARPIDNNTEAAADDAEDEHSRFEILWMERPALIVEGKASVDRVAGEDRFKIRVIDSYQQGNKNPPDAEDELDEDDVATGFKLISVYDQQPRFPSVPKDTFVMAIWDDASRRYRVVHAAVSAVQIVEWFDPGVKDSAVSGGANFSGADDCSLYFAKRIGPADIGVTHDPAETGPKANGNFTCTKSGRYRISMSCMLTPNGPWSYDADKSNDFSNASMRLYRKVSGGSFSALFNGAIHVFQPYGTEFNATHTGQAVLTVNLTAGDKLRILCIAMNTYQNSNAWNVPQANIIFEYLGDQIANVSIP